MYLGVRAVIAKSIARIHKGNLVNHGIIPMIFENPDDYDNIEKGDELEVHDLLDQMQTKAVEIRNVTKNVTFKVRLELSHSELEVISCGGQLRYLKKQLEKKAAQEGNHE